MVAGVAKTSWLVVLRAVGLAAAGMLVASSMAFGQAAVEQYIPSTSPAGHHHKGGGSATRSGSEVGQSSSGTSSGTQGSAGPAKRDGGGSGGDGKGAAAATPAASANVPALHADSGSGGGGNAPGTDYPLTTFVFIVAGIILLVLAARVVPPLIRRIRPRGAP